MPARRGRARKGDRRIDAAIDHFTVMGYAARDVRAVVAHLLEVIFQPGTSSCPFSFLSCDSTELCGGVGSSISPRIDWGFRSSISFWSRGDGSRGVLLCLRDRSGWDWMDALAD